MFHIKGTDAMSISCTYLLCVCVSMCIYICVHVYVCLSVCLCAHGMLEGQMTTVGIGFLFPPCGFKGLNSVCQTWQQAPLPTESSCHPRAESFHRCRWHTSSDGKNTVWTDTACHSQRAGHWWEEENPKSHHSAKTKTE